MQSPGISFEFMKVEGQTIENNTRSTLEKSRDVGLKVNLFRLFKSQRANPSYKSKTSVDFIKVERHRLESKSRSTL